MKNVLPTTTIGVQFGQKQVLNTLFRRPLAAAFGFSNVARSKGLSATLREFVDGFCRRTGLKATVRVSGAVDYLPFDLQRTLLRVVHEALANVQRHAMHRA
jgi:nitrate/nitrite-specific signal transduction histidine kinase